MLRKALQYQRLAGGVVALHEEDPALSKTMTFSWATLLPGLISPSGEKIATLMHVCAARSGTQRC